MKFEAVAKGLQASMVPVFFTRNGKEVPVTGKNFSLLQILRWEPS